MIKLQKREKLLLGALSVLLITVLMMTFFVLPQLDRRKAAQILLAETNAQVLEAKALIARKEVNLQEIDALTESSDALYTLMALTRGYDISLLLSDMLGRHSLSPQRLSISGYRQAPVPTTQTTAEDGVDATVPSNEPQALSRFAKTRTVNLSFKGDRAYASALLDEVSSYNPSALITGYTLSTDTTLGGSFNTYEIDLGLYEFSKPEPYQNPDTEEAN